MHEPAHRQLMTLYALSDQKAAALAQYGVCQRTLAEELGVEPEAETQTLYQRIRAGHLEALSASSQQVSLDRDALTRPESASPHHNLPYPSTSFVGRTRELESVVSSLLKPECRLLSLVGPGGMGKTRLALQTAFHMLDHHGRHFPDGIFMVSLAALASIDDLIPAMASALELSFSGSREPYDQLLAFLQSRQVLFLLDNFEHLAAQADLLGIMLQTIPGLNFLVTSRIQLNLYEEWRVALRGLDVPPEMEQVEVAVTSSAVQLFVERASQIEPSFASDADMQTIGQICRLLEGSPLAIELAAGWAQSYNCHDILLEIQQGLDFLATSIRNVPPRHRSLRVTFDQSWRMLLPKDQATFARLAVFRGGFSREAARTVADTSLTALTRLTDSSMIYSESGRYQIHELLRQYGREQLPEKAEAVTHRQHVVYFASFLKQLEPMRLTHREPDALQQIDLELDNLRAAWRWALANVSQAEEVEAALEMLHQSAPMLAHYYERRCRFREGVRLLQQASAAIEFLTERASPSAEITTGLRHTQAQMRVYEAKLSINLGQYVLAEQRLSQNLPILRQAGDAQTLAEALACLGRTLIRMGQYDQAPPVLQESLAIYLESGDHTGSTAALNLLGALSISQGRFDEAHGYYSDCLRILEETGYQLGKAQFLSNLGTNHLRAGRHTEAKSCYEKAFAAASAVGEGLIIGAVLSNLGSISRILGEYEAAVHYYEDSLLIFREIGEQRWTAASLNGLGLTLVDGGNLTAAKRALREGLDISVSIQSVPDALDSLAALGDIFAAEKDEERAAAVLNFVIEHAATKTSARERCRQALERFSLPETPTKEADVNVDQPGQTLETIVQMIDC